MSDAEDRPSAPVDPAVPSRAVPGPDLASPALTSTSLRAVVAEIYAEVDERRRSGAFPPGLERELDAVFARFSPPAAAGDDLDAVLDRAERAAFIDVDVPTASNRAGVPVVKQTLRKAMAWYLRYVAQQVSAMGGVLVRADRMLASRIVKLEAAVPGANRAVADEQLALHPAPVPSSALAAITAAMAGVSGRMLVASCGRGELVDALLTAGHDCYGTEPRRPLIAEALRRGVDVRDDEPLEHLSRIGADALGAVVLVGVVDTAPLGVQLTLADHAVRCVRTGGVVTIVVVDPDRWRRDDPVRADLAAGHPLHAETWAHVLRQRGCEVSISAIEDGDGGGMRLVRAIVGAPTGS
ncbi:MAG: hypothetical protein AB7V43_11175 [Acidimicrobiia bacterium]